MTDELNQRNKPEVDADQSVENPVDKLARIMGYNNDRAPLAEPEKDESTTAADLEAELMREFGIECLDGQSEEAVDLGADVDVSVQFETERDAPEIPSVQATFIHQPVVQPNYQPVNAHDDVLAEMVQYNVPNPIDNATPSVATPVDNSAQLGVDNFANDLELELAKLQQGLSAGLGADEPIDQSPPVISDVSQEVDETPVSSNYEPPVSTVADKPVAPIEPDIEDAVVDMSAVIETDNDVEQTSVFDIPSVEPVAIAAEPEASFDADLDSELEREFSQMLSDKNSSAGVSDQNTANSDKLAPTAEQDAGSFSDMNAINEEQPEVSPEADVGPVLMHPERIDVSENQAKWQDLQGASSAGSSSMGKLAAIGVFAFLVLGAGGYFIYNNLTLEGGGPNEPIVIKADNSPIKEEPADPGGTSVPNQDLAVYNQVEGNDTSVANQPSLVEATEEPVDIVQRTLDPSLLPLEGRDLIEKSEDRLTSGDQTNIAVINAGTQPLIIPKKVRTVVVQADGTIITREAPAVADPAPVETQTAEQALSTQAVISESLREQSATVPIEQNIVVETDNAEQNNASATTEGQTDTQTVTVAPTPAPTPTPTPAPTTQETQTLAAAQPAQPATQPATQSVAQPDAQPVANFSGYYMQISSQPSLAAAQSSYQNLAGRYNSVLGGRGVEYQKADIAGKGTYHRVRIQAGKRSEANSLCSLYKAAGGSCFVTR